MVQRNPEQLCLLCLLRKAVKTGSHFVPAGLLKSTIGKRDYEEANSIDPSSLSTASHFGRSNLKNTNTEQSPNPHVADYIFCIECEENLGKIESEVIPVLDREIFDRKKAPNFINDKLSDFLILRTCKRVKSNLFSLLIYSLVWRVCLQQRLKNFEALLSARFEEDLRNILNSNLEKSVGELSTIELEFPFNYILITCEDIEDKTATFVNPNVNLTNPYLFYLGTYIVLIYHNECAENIKVSTLPVEVLNKAFLNGKKGDKIKVLIVTKQIWDEVNYQMVEYAHKEYTKNMVIGYAKKKNISLDEAAKALNAKAATITTTDPTEYFEEISRFYEE